MKALPSVDHKSTVQTALARYNFPARTYFIKCWQLLQCLHCKSITYTANARQSEEKFMLLGVMQGASAPRSSRRFQVHSLVIMCKKPLLKTAVAPRNSLCLSLGEHPRYCLQGYASKMFTLQTRPLQCSAVKLHALYRQIWPCMYSAGSLALSLSPRAWV